MIKNGTIFDLKKIQKGILGEKWAEDYCIQEDLSYTKASETDNKRYGIDAYIDTVPTDVKHTNGSIFFGNIYKDTCKFIARHPFREETKSKDYFLINSYDLNNLKIMYHGPIDKFLIENYFTTQTNLFLFKKKILEFNNKKSSTFRIKNCEEYAMMIKSNLTFFLKRGIKCEFSNVNTKSEDIYFRLISYKDLEKEKKYVEYKKAT